MIRLMSIVGARPQFVKLAPVSRAILSSEASRRIEDLIVHTGQHYDAGMSDVFFHELGIPEPQFNLGVGSGSHGAQTGKMLEGLEGLVREHSPDMVVIYGDTNSTVAGALAAAKLHVPVAHIEAGLRSFNRRMPEEINRVVADHVSDLLLAPTETAMTNLATEGLGERAVFTGDVMFDAVLYNRRLAGERSRMPGSLGLDPGQFGVVTLHRAENTDDPRRLSDILAALNETAATAIPLVFPMHPRTRAAIEELDSGWSPVPQLRVTSPLGYLDMLRLVDAAAAVLTDSGGLQKEAFLLDRPCVTMRDETEWLETVQCGANVLVGSDPDQIVKAARAAVEGAPNPAGASRAKEAFGDGNAAAKILRAMLEFLGIASPALPLTN